MIPLRTVVAPCIVALAVALPMSAQRGREPRAARVDSLFAWLNGGVTPGIAVAVVRDAHVVLMRGYGMANLETGTRITPQTVFDIASLSKQFTGFAVNTLISRGLLRDTDDVRRHIPELAALPQRITVDQLLHHTSGIRDWAALLPVAGWRLPDDYLSYRQILTLAFNQRTLNFAPGDEYEYSNTGYVLLAELVQRRTGTSLRDWTASNIFARLGMARTHIRDDAGEVIRGRANGYVRTSDGSYRTTPDNLVAPGSSSVFSTVQDLATWLINFGTGRVGSADVMKRMLTQGRLNNGQISRYTSGITMGSADGYKGLPFFTSAGQWASFNAFDAWFPAQNVGVVVLSNSDVVDAQRAVIQISDIYLADDFAPSSRDGSRQSPSQPAPPRAPHLIGDLVGRFTSSDSADLAVERLGAQYVLRLPGRGYVPLSQVSDSEFVTQTEDTVERLVIARDSAGLVTRLRFRNRVATRRDAQVAGRSTAALNEYAGDYDSEELGTTYHVAMRDGALQLQHRRRGNATLTWFWRDEFGSGDPYMTSIVFTRDAGGHVIGFTSNGPTRSRNVRFVKR